MTTMTSLSQDKRVSPRESPCLFIGVLGRVDNRGHLVSPTLRIPASNIFARSVDYRQLPDTLGTSILTHTRVVLDSDFSGWLDWQSSWFNSDSTQHFTFLNWPYSDLTQVPNLLTWLISDSTHLSQSWVVMRIKSELNQSWPTTHHILPSWAKSCWPWGVGGRMWLDWFFPCNTKDWRKMLAFSRHRRISNSTLTQAVSTWLNSDSNDDQRDTTRLDAYPGFSRPTHLWLGSFKSESNQTWLTTQHNPAQRSWEVLKEVRKNSKVCSF